MSLITMRSDVPPFMARMRLSLPAGMDRRSACFGIGQDARAKVGNDAVVVDALYDF